MFSVIYQNITFILHMTFLYKHAAPISKKNAISLKAHHHTQGPKTYKMLRGCGCWTW